MNADASELVTLVINVTCREEDQTEVQERLFEALTSDPQNMPTAWHGNERPPTPEEVARFNKNEYT